MRRKFFSLLLAGLLLSRVAEANTRWLVTQSTNSDCGPAALATLLHYYLDVPTSEREMEKLTGVQIGIGTTFLKLQGAAEVKGCSADSFRMTWETLQAQLRAYPTPMIVRTLTPQPHFSVLLGIDGDQVFVADPAQGNIVMRKKEFLQRWLIPGIAEKEGFVFIASGPEERVNTKRHTQMVRDLQRQMRRLQTIRPPMARIGR
jgi:predicted double-glycine peptidase